MENIVPRFIQFITEGKDTWQTKGEYYKAAAGILAICSTTGRVLLMLRKYKPGDEDSGKWALPGGMMNDKELDMNVNVGSREAALREFREETGQDEPFDKLISSFVYKSPEGSFDYYNFIGIVPEEFKPNLNEEHDDYKWFTQADLKIIPRSMFHFGVKLLFANDESVIKEYVK